jgi:hypothetical protein
MVVLFLDIDGVLNSEGYWPVRALGPASMLDPLNVRALDALVRASGASLVISSTWREFHAPGEIAGFLREAGCEAPVLGATPMLPGAPRAEEIRAWLDAQLQPPSAFLILDDQEAPFEGLEARVLRTSPTRGLVSRDVRRALAMLGLAEPAPAARWSRVVFLDIDGVLNRANARGLLSSAQGIEPDKVALLNELVRRSGASVVLSSSWRLERPLEQVQAALVAAGFEGVLVDATPSVRSSHRGEEVSLWLEDHGVPPSRCVILDDGNNLAPHAERQVRTDGRHGLEPGHVEQALALFG